MSDLCMATADPPADPAAEGAIRARRVAAVLCAAWCRTCDAYRPVFDALRVAHADVQWHWVDIEDDAELVGDIDVQTFPTLVLADGEHVWFAGPVLPHADVAHRLLVRAGGPESREVDDAPVWVALVRALQASGRRTAL